VGAAEVVQGLALAVPVTGLPENRQRLPVAADGLLKPPQLPVGGAEVAQGPALGGAVPARRVAASAASWTVSRSSR
jgi:hypothetical protein